MTHFVATTEETSVEGLARLFRDNIWKLHRLPESIVSDRGLQFAAEMTKKLNRMLGIETKLSMSHHPQTDGQIERMNQELEQYLRFFIDHRQKDWPEWLASAEFAINNKTHSTTKVSPFIANYSREMRMGVNLREKRKDRKGNGVCKENEESIKGGRGSIGKGTGRDKKTSRWGKKES